MTSVLGPEWHLTSDGINIITENGSIKDRQTILNQALNTDLKEIGSPTLANELSGEKISKLVLQIQKIRNISAPKANEDSQAAPRMLKLSLTDGDVHAQALEISPLNSINSSRTPPGTKILINNAKIVSGYILLTQDSCTVLGGKVPHLIEKWEIAKSIVRNNRRNVSNEDGPPPWVNFGTKIQTCNQDGNFKSLANKNKEINKNNSEFELQRQGAIAEATSGAVKKVFGGRVKHNILPLNNQNRHYENSKERRETNKVKGKNVQKEKDTDEKLLKPSEKVSLFAFLEDKLPTSDTQNTAKIVNSNENSYKGQINPNVNSENGNTLHNSSQKGYQNYYQQSKRDKYEKNASTVNMRLSTASKQFEKPQTIGSQKQNNVARNSSAKEYERPQEKRSDVTFNSKTGGQSNINIQRDKDMMNISNSMEKMSVNSQFASRSLRQHLNLGQVKKTEITKKINENNSQMHTWNINDECMAKYWEDGKFYNAVITAITEKTYAVKFIGYGNIEEVLKTDCLPLIPNHNSRNKFEQNKPYSGSMEFKRSTRNYKQNN